MVRFCLTVAGPTALLLLAACATSCRNGSSGQAADPRSEAGGAAPAACDRPHCPEMVYDRKGNDLIRGVEVDATDVYWCEASPAGLKVRAAKKTGGGEVRTLGDWHDFETGDALVVDDAHVYWLRPGALVRVPKSGGSPQTFSLPAQANQGLGPIKNWGNDILVGGHDCTYAIRMPKNGSTPTVWAISSKSRVGGVTGFETDENSVYCSSGPDVFALDTQSGQSRVLVSNQDMAGPLKKVGADLYFVNNRPIIGKGENLAVLRKDSAGPVDLGPVFGNVGRLQYDSKVGRMYWATGLSPDVCQIGAYDPAGKKTELLFDKVDVMGTTAMDDIYLYWLADHRVMRLQK